MGSIMVPDRDIVAGGQEGEEALEGRVVAATPGMQANPSPQEVAELPKPKAKNQPPSRKWIPPDLKKVETYGERGLSYAQISRALGICEHTLRKHRKQNHEFNEALERGRARGIVALSNKAYEVALAGDVSMLKFLLTVVAGFRETGRLEVDGDLRMEVEAVGSARPPTLTAEQANALIDRFANVAAAIAVRQLASGEQASTEPSTEEKVPA